MSEKIIQLNEGLIKNNLKDLVRDSVEETLNALLEHEADELKCSIHYTLCVTLDCNTTYCDLHLILCSLLYKMFLRDGIRRHCILRR